MTELVTYGLALLLRIRVSVCSTSEQSVTPQLFAYDQSVGPVHFAKSITHKTYTYLYTYTLQFFCL